MKERRRKIGKEWLVDTVGNISYSLVTGAILDYLAGLRGWGIVASRGTATAINTATGGLYGQYRNWVFKKTKRVRESKLMRKLSRAALFYGGTSIANLTGCPFEGYAEIADHFTQTDKLQDGITDFFVFNTFQLPIYAFSVAVGSLVRERTIDVNKISKGASYLATVSPFIGPTLGLYLDELRKVFGLKSASQNATLEGKIK